MKGHPGKWVGVCDALASKPLVVPVSPGLSVAGVTGVMTLDNGLVHLITGLQG